jgi:hypothetical protein
LKCRWAAKRNRVCRQPFVDWAAPTSSRLSCRRVLKTAGAAVGGGAATDAEYFRWAELRIDALNHALRDLDTARVRYHICWGSWNGPHTYDVPLKKIVNLLLKLNVGGVLDRGGKRAA